MDMSCFDMRQILQIIIAIRRCSVVGRYQVSLRVHYRSLALMLCPTMIASDQAAALTPCVFLKHCSRVCLTCSPIAGLVYLSVYPFAF